MDVMETTWDDVEMMIRGRLVPVCSLPFSPLQWSFGNRKALRTLEPPKPSPSDPACACKGRREEKMKCYQDLRFEQNAFYLLS